MIPNIYIISVRWFNINFRWGYYWRDFYIKANYSVFTTLECKADSFFLIYWKSVKYGLIGLCFFLIQICKIRQVLIDQLSSNPPDHVAVRLIRGHHFEHVIEMKGIRDSFRRSSSCTTYLCVIHLGCGLSRQLNTCMFWCISERNNLKRGLISVRTCHVILPIPVVIWSEKLDLSRSYLCQRYLGDLLVKAEQSL